MTATGRMAKAERKNTIWPTGATSPRWRTKADIAANNSAEISLKPMALNRFMKSYFRRAACLHSPGSRGRQCALARGCYLPGRAGPSTGGSDLI